MLNDPQKEQLRDKVYQLLWDVGMKIESDTLRDVLLTNGCKDAPSGRIRISRELIEQMSAVQKKGQEEDTKDQELHHYCGIDWAHHIVWNNQQQAIRERLKQEFVMSAFDCGPTKYYNYQKERLDPVKTDIFIEMKKFAQATPEIGYISTWYRQDAPPKIERIESLIMGLKYTNKLDGIEAIFPEVIKYLRDISEIITGRPGDSSYLAGSECITAPLILDKRSAEDIVERKTRGVHRYHIASMPTIGVSTPVTIAGTTVMMAAEILGGMAACFAFDPEADISGRAISLIVDMQTADNLAASPEVTAANLAVRELFDTFWGGHCWAEVSFSPATVRPGLQAVYDNFAGQWRTSKLLGKADIPYAGTGTLGAGGVGSPVQFMLDLEIRKSQYALKDHMVIDEEQLPFNDICDATTNNENFLSSNHTLRNFQDLWSYKMLATDNTSGPLGWAGNEKAILDRCEQQWRDNVKNWQAPEWPKETMNELEKLLKRAKKELVD